MYRSRCWFRARVSGGLIALAIGVSGALGHATADEQRAAARSLAEQGAQAFSERRFSDAIDRFERAESLIHSPVHLLFLARSSVELGLLVKAQEAYIKITRENLAPGAPAAFAQAVEQAHEELEALKPRIPRVTVRINAPGGVTPELSIDGQPVSAVLVGVPVPVDPGQRRFEARGEGAQPASEELTLVEGQLAEIELTLNPSALEASSSVADRTPAAEPVSTPTKGGSDALRYGAYAGFGIGAVGIGVGTVFLLSASSAQEEGDRIHGECDPGCSDTEQSRAEGFWADSAQDKTVALIGYVGAGVGIAAGVTLLILSSKDDQSKGSEATTRARIVPYFGGTSAGIVGTF